MDSFDAGAVATKMVAVAAVSLVALYLVSGNGEFLEVRAHGVPDLAGSFWSVMSTNVSNGVISDCTTVEAAVNMVSSETIAMMWLDGTLRIVG